MSDAQHANMDSRIMKEDQKIINSSKLSDLYREGRSYSEYLEASEEDVKTKHLHYLDKMIFTKEEEVLLKEMDAKEPWLVFCSTSCNDCRITLAVLENLRKQKLSIQYRIVPRDGNEELMISFSGDRRIPLILGVTTGKVIYNEFPDAIRPDKSGYSEEEKEEFLLRYRKGAYKAEILQQFIN